MLRQRKTPGVGQVNKNPTFKEIVKQRAETDYSAQYEKIRKLNDKYHAYIHVFRNLLRRRDFRNRPLHGVSLAVKDVFHIKGYVTTAGSKAYREKARITAEAVERLLDAGAVVNGKTNLHEFAFGVSNKNPHFGDCINPYSDKHVSGGSSGGSAVAVALGMCDAALGTDTAGSVRIPASFCGVVGFKPTQHLISRRGVFPLSWSLDHVGFLTKSVWDAACLFSSCLDGLAKPLDVRPRNLKGLKIGVPSNYFLDHLHDDVRANFEDAMEKAASEGCVVKSVKVEEAKLAAYARFIIAFSEAAALHLALSRGSMQDYSEEVRSRIVGGLSIPASVYINALKSRKKLTQEFRRVYRECDVIALPTTIIPAHRLEEEKVEVQGEEYDVRTASLKNTEVFNFFAVPAISIPNGFTREGLPTGLQLVADVGCDMELLRTAYAFERLLGAQPPL
jgi:aspartyl-tRNA(Asn)/glutamyl-tRNA(Gln) amidotransferase subunit A